MTLIDFQLDYHPSGLDLSGDWLYWTNWRENNLMRVNASNMADSEEMIGGLVQSRDVSVFHRNRNHDGGWG